MVQRIFDMFESGIGKDSIARKLNHEGIPCPSEYKRLMGERYTNNKKLESTRYWTYSTIHRILQNEMYLGNMVEFAEKEEIFANPLHPYTQALFSAIPVPDPTVKMNRIILEGNIPSPANPPSGCKFHTRCPNCMERCKTELPPQREIEPGHYVVCHLYENQV